MAKKRPVVPTGPPVNKATRAPDKSPFDSDDDDVPEHDGPSLLVKTCYEWERSRWESRKEGKHLSFEAPAVYSGAPAKTIEGQTVVQARKSSEWEAILRYCKDNGIEEPAAYIRMAFDHTPVDRKMAPQPKDLRADKYLAIWRKYYPKLLEHMETKLDIERRAGSAAIASHQIVGTRRDDSYAIVLMNRHVAMSPLMRYCLAISIGGMRFRRIARRFEPEAILQFMRYRTQYMKVWRDVLPKGFEARAVSIYPHLLQALN